MDYVFFSDDYYMYKDGFGAGIADFIVNGTNNSEFIDDLKFVNTWDYGYFDGYCYCLRKTLTGKKIDLLQISGIIDELFVQFVGEYNRLYNEKIPAYTLVLNYDGE